MKRLPGATTPREYLNLKKLLPGIIAAAALALTLGCSNEQGPQPIKAGDYDGPPPGAGKSKDAAAEGQGS